MAVECVDFGVENAEKPVERSQQASPRALASNPRMDGRGRQVSRGVNDPVYDECGRRGYARCRHRYAKTGVCVAGVWQRFLSRTITSHLLAIFGAQERSFCQKQLYDPRDVVSINKKRSSNLT